MLKIYRGAVIFCLAASLTGCHSGAPKSVKIADAETIAGAKNSVAGNQAEATLHYRAALKSDANNPERKFKLAMSLRKEGKSAEALPLFQEIVSTKKAPLARFAQIEVDDIKKH